MCEAAIGLGADLGQPRGPSRSTHDDVGDEIDHRRHSAGRRERKHPGKYDIGSDVPPHRRALARETDAGNRARDRVGGRGRRAHADCHEDGHGAAELGAEALHRFDVGDARPIVCTMRQPPTSVPTALAA